jgi:hypothetical protein
MPLQTDGKFIGQTKRYAGGDGGVWKVVDEPSQLTLRIMCTESGDSSEQGDKKTISKLVWVEGMYNPDT